MDGFWQALIANLAVVALTTSIWSQLTEWLENRPAPIKKIVVGMLGGLGAVTSMVMAVEVAPGVLFDLRACVVAVGSFFGGPLATVIAIAIAGGFRLLEGGSGTLAGLFSILMAALSGLALRALARPAIPGPLWIVALGVTTAGIMLLTAGLIVGRVSWDILEGIVPATAILAFVATLLMGFAIRTARIGRRDRNILTAAIAQAPEFLYVKDRDGRFLVSNSALARHHGLASAQELSGKTEWDLTTPERAAQIDAQEKAVLRSGDPLLDYEESMLDRNGRVRWFRTAKAPVSDNEGNIIGLAGVTVDHTDLKRLEHELIESRNQLSLALSEMSDGLAVFDANGYLLYCNEQYREAFPLTANLRVPGAHIKDILLACARLGEQLEIPATDHEGWADRVASLLRVPNVVTVELFNGRYLQLRNRPASNDTAVVIVTDVTDLKRAERALIDANADLSRQATTDPLTGLLNRRAFDEILAREMARCGRAGETLSLILLDVDHFKAYNDTFGHQAGDRCLVIIAHAMQAALHRATDAIARYGGEEFAIILPGTSREGAIAVAERIRAAISAQAALFEPSSRSVTASLGVAEFDLSRAPLSPADLISAADRALYAAKTGGRDRVVAAGQVR